MFRINLSCQVLVYKFNPKICTVDEEPHNALDCGQLWRTQTRGIALAKRPPSVCRAAHQKGHEQHLNIKTIKDLCCNCDTKLLLLF